MFSSKGRQFHRVSGRSSSEVGYISAIVVTFLVSVADVVHLRITNKESHKQMNRRCNFFQLLLAFQMFTYVRNFTLALHILRHILNFLFSPSCPWCQPNANCKFFLFFKKKKKTIFVVRLFILFLLYKTAFNFGTRKYANSSYVKALVKI